jgi:hypothetical protein
MTEASERALQRVRDLSTLEWYVIPLLAFVFYVWVREIKEARVTGNWDAVFAGLTLFGVDFINETVNGWILHLTQRSALWTVTGPSALVTMVGWNVEIMFMFALAGIVYYHSLGPGRGARILGLPEPWFWAVVYSAICVLVEVVLNRAGIFVWEYRFWNRTAEGLPLIFLFGYFHFYVAVILVLSFRSNRARAAAVAAIYSVAIVANVVALGVLGWRY